MISFDPTPYAAPTDPADAPASFQTVSDTTLANFEKINTWFAPLVPAFVRSVQASLVGAWTADGAWHDFPAANWAPVTLVIPEGCGGVLVGYGGYLDNRRPVGAWWALRPRISGATTWTPGPDPQFAEAILVENRTLTCSRLLTIPADQLTVGGSIVVTPEYRWSGTTDGSTSNFTFLGGVVWAAALI